VCRKHADKVSADDRVRGIARNVIYAYIEGTKNVTKFSVMRHLQGKVRFVNIISVKYIVHV
jgi:hypothetical protein